MEIDGVRFNDAAVKKMSESEFIQLHSDLKPNLKADAREKWLRVCYYQIVGKKMYSEKKYNIEEPQ